MEEKFNGFEEEKKSMMDIFIDVITAPKEIFNEIQFNEAKTSNYILPLIMAIAGSLIFIFVAFSQPEIIHELEQQQSISLEKMLNDGKLTQEQFDKAEENNFGKPGTPMYYIFGGIGTVVGLLVVLFLTSFVLWITGKIFFKSGINYLKATEAVGLSYYISFIGTIITLIFVLLFGSLYAGPNLALFVIPEFDLNNQLHVFLQKMDLTTFWVIYFLSVGFSKLWETKLINSLLTILGLWGTYIFLSVFIGLKIAG